ncbi:MAG: hypothetical protein ABMA64_37520, partial [Myxococcota bacterium]
VPTPADLRRHEDWLRGGVDAFVDGGDDRPELWWAANRAAYDGLVFCEHSRSAQFWCRDETVARFREVRATQAPPGVPTFPASGVSWTIRAADGCDDLLTALAPPPPPPTPTIEAALELDRCVVTRGPSVWTDSRCTVPHHSGPCADGSSPEPTVFHCESGMPCQQPPPTCPCKLLDRAVRVDVHARMIVGDQVYTLDQRADQAEWAVVWPLEPLPPDPVGVDDLVAQRFAGGLGYATAALDLLAESDPDPLAVRCATLGSGASYGPDLFGLWQRVGQRCADAFLREPQPRPPPVPEPEPVATNPHVAVDTYPYRVRVLDDAERRETEAALERRSPGWDFEVSALGYIEGGKLARRDPPAEVARALADEQFLALGFAAPPTVSENGERRSWLTAGTRYAEVFDDGTGLTLRGHGWPFECPEVDRAAMLAPFTGRPITIHPPFHPCDPVRAGDCEPPPTRVALLEPGWIRTGRFVALVSDGDDAALHCAVAIGLDPTVELTGGQPLPSVLDTISGEPLPTALDAAQVW